MEEIKKQTSIYSFIGENLNENSIIFEIGVHIGIDSLKIKEYSKSNFIYGFEPDPRNIEILKKRQRIEIFKEFNNFALSNVNGHRDFYLSSGHPGETYDDPDMNLDWSASNSLRKPKEHLNIHEWCKFENVIKVPTIRLDYFCINRKINKIDFIWMDVQGSEDLVLSGGINMVKKTKYIYTEYNNLELYENSPTLSTILQMLGENWEIHTQYENDVLLENKSI